MIASNPLKDTERGMMALKYFHNESLKHYSSNYPHTRMEQLVDAMKVKYGKVDVVGAIGMNVYYSEINEPDIEEAMEAVARQGQGRLPENWNSWLSALTDAQQTFEFSDWFSIAEETADEALAPVTSAIKSAKYGAEAVGFVATETAKDIGSGAVAIGGAVIDTGKTLLMFAPLAIVVGIGFIAYAKTRQVAGR